MIALTNHLKKSFERQISTKGWLILKHRIPPTQPTLTRFRAIAIAIAALSSGDNDTRYLPASATRTGPFYRKASLITPMLKHRPFTQGSFLSTINIIPPSHNFLFPDQHFLSTQLVWLSFRLCIWWRSFTSSVSQFVLGDFVWSHTTSSKPPMAIDGELLPPMR